jgi:ketosteroid isomerase-like protein
MPSVASVVDAAFATAFAAEWIAAWNSHDLARILSHYTDDFEMRSPLIVQRGFAASGVLKGKAAVGEYWRQGLQATPPIRSS